MGETGSTFNKRRKKCEVRPAPEHRSNNSVQGLLSCEFRQLYDTGRSSMWVPWPRRSFPRVQIRPSNPQALVTFLADAVSRQLLIAETCFQSSGSAWICSRRSANGPILLSREHHSSPSQYHFTTAPNSLAIKERCKKGRSRPTVKHRQNDRLLSPKTGMLPVAKKYSVVAYLLYCLVLSQAHPAWRRNCQHAYLVPCRTPASRGWTSWRTSRLYISRKDVQCRVTITQQESSVTMGIYMVCRVDTRHEDC
jgi:hypothetical protein